MQDRVTVTEVSAPCGSAPGCAKIARVHADNFGSCNDCARLTGQLRNHSRAASRPAKFGLCDMQEQPAGDVAQDADPSVQPEAAADVSPAPGIVEEPPKPKTALQLELEKAQQTTPDFNQWVALEKMTETEKDIETIREVYNSLLSGYPLCYGYWKKFAEAEHKHSGPQWASQVFERGTQAVPYSVDLWGHFCTYKQKIAAPADEVRKTFEDGIAYVGTDYLAHGLWDKYIKFETEQGTPENVASLYRRIMDAPLKELDRFHSGLETFAGKHQASEILPHSQIEELRETIFTARKSQKTALEQTPAAAQTEDAKEGTPLANGDVEMTDVSLAPDAPAEQLQVDPNPAIAVNPEGAVPALETTGQPEAKIEDAPKQQDQAAAEQEGTTEVPESAASITEQEVKAYWLSLCESAYEESKREVGRRKLFDTVIKRPYFHVKPLPAVQLHAWNSYVDYILTKEDVGTIVRLFERCLVACASYPEFWMRYVRYTHGSNASNTAAVLNRAQGLFCKDDVGFNLFAAKFQEMLGDVDTARKSYTRVVNELAPGLISALLQAASFERRQSNVDGAKALFDSALSTEDTEQEPDRKASVSVLYARLLAVDCQDEAAAREVYSAALSRHPSQRFLWEAAIHFEEYTDATGRSERVIELYKRAIAALDDAKTANESDLETMSQQMLDFADRQASLAVIESIQAEHFDKYNPYKLATSSKRSAEDASQGPAAKRAATYADPNAGAAAGALPGPPPVAAQMPYASQAPVHHDPYAAQAYPAAPVQYSYADYYQQYPQQAQYAGYQYPAYQ